SLVLLLDGLEMISGRRPSPKFRTALEQYLEKSADAAISGPQLITDAAHLYYLAGNDGLTLPDFFLDWISELQNLAYFERYAETNEYFSAPLARDVGAKTMALLTG